MRGGAISLQFDVTEFWHPTGDGGGGYDHTAILASLFRVEAAADYGGRIGPHPSFLATSGRHHELFRRRSNQFWRRLGG